MAGILNSIKTTGAWRTQTWKEEWEQVKCVVCHDFAWLISWHKGVKKLTNKEEKHEEKQLEIVEPEEVLPASPVINVDKDSKVIDDSVVSDDEFFDDFFGDE